MRLEGTELRKRLEHRLGRRTGGRSTDEQRKHHSDEAAGDRDREDQFQDVHGSSFKTCAGRVVVFMVGRLTPKVKQGVLTAVCRS